MVSTEGPFARSAGISGAMVSAGGCAGIGGLSGGPGDGWAGQMDGHTDDKETGQGDASEKHADAAVDHGHVSPEADGPCSAGFASCSVNGPGACNTNVATDTQSCGSCGADCFAANTKTNPTCAQGKCVFDCEDGFADCNGIGSDGCEATVATDPHNCGACGHDCQGATCTAGVCQPIIVAAGAAYSSPLVMTDTDVYWFIGGGDVATCPKTGCASATQLTSRQSGTALAIDATTVYFSNYRDSDLWSCAMSGCSQHPKALAPTTEPQPYAVAVDATNVYFTNITDVFNGVGDVVSCPKAGCGSASPTVLVKGQEFPQDFIVTGNKLLWTSANLISTCTLPACTDVTELVLNEAVGLATDGTTLFFGGGGGTLFSCALSGCGQNPTVLYNGSEALDALAVDSTTIYVVQNVSVVRQPTVATIFSCPKTGCSTLGTVIALTEAGPIASLAVDASFLYWVNGQNLVRLAKP